MIEMVGDASGIRLKVVGVGNAGGMIVKRVSRERLPGVQCSVINTALKDLGNCPEIRALQIGTSVTRGQGAGQDPQVGRSAAMEDRAKVIDFLGQSDIVFLVAGFGKGTGTGATPVIAEIAREAGALTVALVTTPFDHEGARRRETADEGLREMKGTVDMFIPLPNQKLCQMGSSPLPLEAAYAFMDEAILSAVRGVVDVLVRAGRNCLDFADVRSLFKGAGQAAFSVGTGKGDNRVADALKGLSEYLFLRDAGISGARSMLVSLAGGWDLSLDEVTRAVEAVAAYGGPDARMAQGVYQEEALNGEFRAVVLLAGLASEEPHAELEALRGIPAVVRGTSWVRGNRQPGELELPGVTGQDTNVPAYIRRTRNGPTTRS